MNHFYRALGAPRGCVDFDGSMAVSRFKDQITRSSLSVPSNIAEGEERAGLKEQIQFLNIAKGSAGELMTQIIIGEKIGYLDKATSEQWQHKIMVIAKQLGALMNAKKKTL